MASPQNPPVQPDSRNEAKTPAPGEISITKVEPQNESRFQFETAKEARAPARAFVLPPAAPRNSSSTGSQELPAVNAGLPRVDVPVLPLGSVAPPAPAPSAALASGVSEHSKAVTNPTPAVLTYDPGVTVPPELKLLIAAPVTVRVRVSVDASGRVTRAEAVRDGRIHALLLSAATNAALRCRFRPARLGDTAVPSEVNINFQVRP